MTDLPMLGEIGVSSRSVERGSSTDKSVFLFQRLGVENHFKWQ